MSFTHLTLEFSYKVPRCISVRDDRSLELPDFCFVLVATIEKDNVITVLLDQLVNLGWLQVNTAANDAILVDLKLMIAIVKANQLAPVLDAHSWKMIA